MAGAGLQAQRTALSWGRTALALIVTTLLVLRAGIRSGESAIQLSGVVVAAVAAGFLAIAVLRSRQLRHAKVGAPAAWMLVSAAVTLSVAALASVAAFWFSLA
jgi:hypothetical protein